MQPDINTHSNTEEPIIAKPSGGEVTSNKPKQNSGTVLVIVLLLVLATGGIGFGVWTMVDSETQKNELSKQISSLKEKNNELTEIINNTPTVDNDTAVELNGDIALDLLQEASVGKQLGYTVGYANVHAKCINGDKESYWITYANGHRVNEESPQFGNIMFEKDDNGEWTFELPGFTGYTDELTTNCEILHGDK